MADNGLLDWVSEAIEPLGHVTSRSMMGGRTLYCDGIIFAIIARDELWFKADAVSDSEWDAIDAGRFTLEGKTGQPFTMNYRRAPSDVYDEPEAMCRWAELAIGAGRRVKPKRKTA